MEQQKTVLLHEEEVQRMISRMAHEILEKSGGPENLALLGIRSRGAYLAERIGRKIESIVGAQPPVGIIDVTPYRDDRNLSQVPGETRSGEALVSVDEKTVVLVDDVIYTGRTVRAAWDRIGRMGKPRKIFVAILVDRGDRELPIKADIVGKNVQVPESERVNVQLRELDGVDQVTIAPYPQRPARP
jgi:pyrimidine operon attenuation protein/uracil phosphoribosyltransferase